MIKPLLSIIVPAYNAQETIGKLIDSIISQKYDNYELIIVNDGSTDKTKKIIESYLNKSDKIIFIDKENTGVGDTRNKGMERARGKYITFADSDDFYCNDFFEKIIPEIEKSNFELLVFNANVFNYGKYVGKEIAAKYKNNYFEDENGVIRYLKGDFCYRFANCPWNKIYINRIVKDNNLKFEANKKRGQDLIFNIAYVSKIKTYRYVDISLYNYNLNYDRLKSNKYIQNSVKNLLEYYDLIKKICVENSILNYENYMGLFFLRRFPGIILNEVNNPNYNEGKENIKIFLNDSKMKYILKKVRLRDLDFKLFTAYIIYKLRLYTLIYFVLRKKIKVK